MTKKEARNLLNNSRPKGNNAYSIMLNEALDMAIEALEQKPCEEGISREQAKSDYADWFGYGYEDNTYYKHLCNMPSVTPQPKMGHWINDEDLTDWYDITYKCSLCGRGIIVPYESKDDLYKNYPYCHCGAKMREVL